MENTQLRFLQKLETLHVRTALEAKSKITANRHLESAKKFRKMIDELPSVESAIVRSV